jgi:hypothetical protein
MPIEVDVPDLGVVEFPDGTSEGEIQKQLASYFRKPAPLTGNSNDQDAMVDSIRATAVPTSVPVTPTEGALEGVYRRVTTPLATLANSVSDQQWADAMDAWGQMSAVASSEDPSEAAFQQALATPSRKPTKAEETAAALQRVTGNAVNSMTSPLGIATLGQGYLPQTASRLVSGAFIADTARNVPEQARAAGEASVNGSLGEQVETMGNLGVAIGMGGLLGRDVATPARPREALQRVIEETQLPNPTLAELSRLNPENVQNQPLSPTTVSRLNALTRVREARQREANVAAEADLMTAAEAEGRTPVDQFVGESRFGTRPTQRPSRAPIQTPELPSTARRDIEGGRVSFRRGAEETASIAQENPTAKEPNAVQVQEPGPGVLRTEEGQPRQQVGLQEVVEGNVVDQVPAGEAAVPKAKPENVFSAVEIVSPAVKIGKETFRANSHPEAIAEAMKRASEPEIGDALTEVVTSPNPDNYGFIVKDTNGTEKFVSRAEGAQVFEKLTGEKPAKPDSLTSEDWRASRFFKKPETAIDYSAEVQSAKAPSELADVFRTRNTSLTQEAYRLGEKTDTQAKLDQVNSLAEKAKQDVATAMAKGDFDAASVHAMQGQFYREAAEFATGTKSAGAYQQRNMPDYVPPMKAKSETAPASRNIIEEWADKTISDSRGRLGANLDPQLLLAHATKLAFQLGRSAVKFADWSAQMIKEHGPEIRQHLETIWREALTLADRIKSDKPEATTPKHPKSQLEKAAPETAKLLSSEREVVRSVETGESKMRRSVDRALRSEEIPDAARDLLAADPESRYNVQRVAPKEGQPSVSDLVSKMPVSALEAVDVRSNIYVASKIELAKRLMRSGDIEGGYQVFKRLAQEGTSFGQNIYQFTLLKDVDPTAISRIVDRQLTEQGYDPLTKDQQKAITQKSAKSIEQNEAAQAAKDAWQKDPTPENASKADAATEKAKASAMELQKEILNRQPKTLPQILKAVIQGNLLTPLSQSANLIGNMTFMPARAGSEAIAAGINALDSFIRNKPREIEFFPLRQATSAVRGGIEGTKTIPDILKKGQGEVNQGERFRGLRPLTALKNLFLKNPEAPTVSGKVPWSDRIGMAVEGTFGIPAEIMLRGLAAGDAPFRGKAHAQAVDRQLSLAKVSKADLPMARKYPELFLSKEQMDTIYQDTTAAIFQQPSRTVNALNRWIRQTGGEWGDLAATTVVPYRLTPWNLIGETFSYHPLIAAAQAANYTRKGNTAAAQRAAAKAVVGSVLTYAGWWLYEKGLLSPSLDDKDEQQKGRLASQAVMPPNHVNITGLSRALEGGRTAFQPGDKTVDTSRLGLVGAVFYTTANLGRDFERDPKSSSENAAEWMKNSVMEEAKYGLNQSFLKGTATALEAIKSGKGDDFIRGLENTILSIPIPNTVPAISRATSDSKTVVKDDKFFTQLDNIIQDKLRVFGAGKELPVKRGIWGEPLPETPEGSNPYAYHFFDITRSQSVPPDPASVEVYRLWRRTGDTSAIPTPPSKSITINRTQYELTPAQVSDLQAAVGPLRKTIVTRLTENPNFLKAPDEIKLQLLSSAYEKALAVGKAELFKKEGQNLQVKAKRPGFAEQ